jgi:DNA-binding NarL/FixJ family response regulator
MAAQKYQPPEVQQRPDALQTPDKSSWVFPPRMMLAGDYESDEDLFGSKELLLFAINNIQDGVSILDREMNVRFVNESIRSWYTLEGDLSRQKCFRVYHSSDQPCENCPILKTIQDKAPYIGFVKFSVGGNDKGWQQLFSIPIFNSKNDLIGVLEYVRDITIQNQLEIDLNNIMGEYQNLEKRNEAINHLLAQRRKEREQLEETIMHNISNYILPSLDHIRSKTNPQDLNLIESLIDEIIYPITRKRSSALERLTTRELQIARKIREGKTSGEIANDLGVSKKTVDFHRANLRRKLGLGENSDHKGSLRGFLETNL